MHRASLPVRLAALAVSLVLFAITGGTAAAVADDYINRDLMPTGTLVAG